MRDELNRKLNQVSPSRWMVAVVLAALAGCASQVPLPEMPPMAPLPGAAPAPSSSDAAPAGATLPSSPAAVVPPAAAASAPSPAASAPIPSAAQVRPAVVDPQVFAAEQRWLSALFKDTPVTIAEEYDGALRVEVPTAFSFDPEVPQIKPALKVVVDRVSQSLLRLMPLVVHVGAPAPLMAERVAAVRKQLNANGVALVRILAMREVPAFGVMLRVAPPSPDDPPPDLTPPAPKEKDKDKEAAAKPAER